MFARQFGRRVRRRHPFKLAFVAALSCAALFAYAAASKKSAGAYPLAADLPRGALLYAQFSDLPALVKRWHESKLKERYLASTNFQQFQSRHLALKLVERWEEFNNALGFPLDLPVVGEAAENRAALAVYDIGRLEMVFIAPLGEEKLAATKFFQNAGQFEETELPDGTVYYSRDVDADRGRRQQQFAFASLGGRLVVATSEPLLLRTLANIKGTAKNDRLSDDTAFKTLSAEVTPHFLTVWMNQSKLNDDWYFKHYWVMRNVEQLRNIRASMLDLELQDDKWIEHRNFLLEGQMAAHSSSIPAEEAKRIFNFIPPDAPYFKLRALEEADGAASLVRDTFMERLPDEKKRAAPKWRWQSYDDSDFYPANESGWGGDAGYYSLSPNFDSLIDDPIDAKVEDEDELGRVRLRQETERKFVAGLRESINAARPSYAATATSPHDSGGQFFVEFRRGAVLTFRSPGNFSQQAFESAISGLAESRLMISGSSAGGEGDLHWADGRCGSQPCRLLTMPMLGWTIGYAFRGSELILANSPEMLQAMLDADSASRSLDSNSSSPFHDLTVVRFNRREEAFDSFMRKLDAPRVKAYWKERRKKEQGDSVETSQEFFSGNIASLLDVASPVREIRIKRNSLPSRLREEVEIILK
ncbi:MAG TPA: hypothetical protein VGW12_14455 [Pyrinomonadaceae bacterium]|nr:hypothetical protein [Pyrinomonadaceae bacterium]